MQYIMENKKCALALNFACKLKLINLLSSKKILNVCSSSYCNENIVT